MFQHISAQAIVVRMHPFLPLRSIYINAQACKTLHHLYTLLQSKYLLPQYFGNNLDALFDVLQDVDFFAQQHTEFIFYNQIHLLHDEPEQRTTLIDLFQTVTNPQISIMLLP